MAFKDYMFLIGPGIKIISNFFQALENKKQDDGKVSISEFLECFSEMFTEVLPIVEPIIRDDDKEEKPEPEPGPTVQ